LISRKRFLPSTDETITTNMVVLLASLVSWRANSIMSSYQSGTDFATGSLTKDPSYARPNKIFTAETRINTQIKPL
jgi:hypothetical protein